MSSDSAVATNDQAATTVANNLRDIDGKAPANLHNITQATGLPATLPDHIDWLSTKLSGKNNFDFGYRWLAGASRIPGSRSC